MALQLKQLTSAEEIRSHAAAWNTLWQQSDTPSPAARAETVAGWIEQFAPRRPIRAAAVFDGPRMVAAIPLYGSRVKHLLRVGALATNAWTSAGDLMVDPDCDVPSALDCLCQGIAEQAWPLLWLEDVPVEAPRWRAMFGAFARTGMSYDIAPQYRCGQVEVGSDWAAYEASRDGNHRRTRKRYARKLAEKGKLRLSVVNGAEAAELDRLVAEGFAVEDRSWKGAEGTSVVKCGLLEFFQGQARQLAAAGCLELVHLYVDEQPIAFGYCWRAKGVRFIAKLGYDEAFRQYGPGQQLVMHYLERLHGADECHTLDFWGRLMPWSETWTTSSYEIARVVVAPPKLFSRTAFFAYETLRRRRSGKTPAIAAEREGRAIAAE